MAQVACTILALGKMVLRNRTREKGRGHEQSRVGALLEFRTAEALSPLSFIELDVLYNEQKIPSSEWSKFPKMDPA